MTFVKHYNNQTKDNFSQTSDRSERVLNLIAENTQNHPDTFQ